MAFRRGIVPPGLVSADDMRESGVARTFRFRTAQPREPPASVLEVPLAPCDAARLATVLGDADCVRHHEALRAYADVVDGRCVWHVNSAATGGGVSELLSGLLP